MNKTWNLTLMATDDQPEMTFDGLSHEQARDTLLRLMYDTPESAREYAEEVGATPRTVALAA